MQNHLPNNLLKEETTCGDITNIIQNIKSKSSTGFSNISTELANNSMESIGLPMAEIFNSTIRSGM